MTNRKIYTEEFKREAVRLALERGNVSATARDLGIGSTCLDRWVHALRDHPESAFPGNGNAQDPELAALRRELKRVKEENEILKKTVGIFSVRQE